VRRAIRELGRGKLQSAIREVLEEHSNAQRQGWDERQSALQDENLRAGEGHARGIETLQRELHESMTAELSAVRAEVEALRGEVGALRGELVGLELRARRDMYYSAEVTAAAESAQFVLAHLPTAPTFRSPEETQKHAAGLVSVPGSVLEFGVATGTTLRILMAELPGRTVAGFDVFTGLPEDWRSGFPAGMFAQESLPDVPGAELVEGLFEDTLPGYLAEHAEQVALLHIDADLYSAAKTVLELVGPRLVAGSVVLFDEYFNYPGWQQGEHRAWQEYVEKTGLTFRYGGYTYDHEQMIVVVTGAEDSGQR